ncbi:SCO6745 family protein [Streptomyces regalis]|uniref:SalK n=1 Tax=Streptomyces regalis TaxID=68262 RepID=A0A101JQA7_9ACTN|nr:SalK [Streptomyces regalis]
MSPLSGQALRHCHHLLNILHSTVYFSPDFDRELSGRGLDDPMGRYLAGRSAALGRVGPGVVTATFYSFQHGMVARHLPAVWHRVSPEEALAARLRAADNTLRRVLGEEAVSSRAMRDAAGLALRAAEAGIRPGRPLYAAHADQPVPREPHLALWYAATLLREHRGDSHVAALGAAGLDGLEALVSHSAGDDGMPREVVMTKRGWTAEDWSAAEDRLRERGLMTADGSLTEEGRRMRLALEDDTDRRDRAPYQHLGEQEVAELTALTADFVRAAGTSGAFPAELEGFFLGAVDKTELRS